MQARTVTHHGKTIAYHESEATGNRTAVLVAPPEAAFEGVRAFAARPDIPWKVHLTHPTRSTLTAAADEVIALTEALDMRHITLVGLSSGAIVAILVAARVPQLIDALVLIEPPLDRQGLTTEVNPAEALALDYPIWDATGMSRCPTLIARGDNSEAFPPDALDYLRIAMMSSVTCTIPGVGHYVLRDAPDAIATAVYQFLFPRRR